MYTLCTFYGQSILTLSFVIYIVMMMIISCYIYGHTILQTIYLILDLVEKIIVTGHSHHNHTEARSQNRIVMDRPSRTLHVNGGHIEFTLVLLRVFYQSQKKKKII